jgi:hypothetical protein
MRDEDMDPGGGEWLSASMTVSQILALAATQGLVGRCACDRAEVEWPGGICLWCRLSALHEASVVAKTRANRYPGTPLGRCACGASGVECAHGLCFDCHLAAAAEALKRLLLWLLGQGCAATHEGE